MGVMMLAANKGSTLEVEITGKDENEAMLALVDLVSSYFGESE
jgi:phosphocarrier protein